MSRGIAINAVLGTAVAARSTGKPNNMYSRKWSTDPVTTQPMSALFDEEDGDGSKAKLSRPLMPLLSMDGVPTGLEFLIELNQIVVKKMVELFDVMKEYQPDMYKLYNIVNAHNQRIYFAAVSSVPRENCCDVQRKFKVSIVDYSGRIVLVIERPYSCVLDATNNCWICCCWCGTIGGDVSVKLPDGTLIGQITHSFDCCNPNYEITDPDENTIMRIKGRSCGDCCNVPCAYLGCKGREFQITNEDSSQVIGVVKRPTVCDDEKKKEPKELCDKNEENVPDPTSFGVTFPKNLSLKWKALVMGSLFLIDFMYFDNGPPSGH